MDKLENDSKLIKLKGDCTIYEVDELCGSICEALKQETSLTLDLSSVERVDASFLQLLMSIKSESDQRQITFNINHASDSVTNLINDLHFSQLTSINTDISSSDKNAFIQPSESEAH